MKTKIVALMACAVAFAAQGVDEYVRARYMRVDKLGEGQTLTFSSADACRPGEYRHPLNKYPQKGQITPERIADPWWEWDLKECRPVVLVYVNALKKGGHAFDLYGARLILMDDNRRVVWHQTIWNVGGQISFDISPRYSLTDLLGQVLPETPMREGLVSAPPPPPVKDLRRAIAKKLYNPAAMARAIEAYAVKHPDLFPDRDDLLKEAQAAAASPDNAAAARESRIASVYPAISINVASYFFKIFEIVFNVSAPSAEMSAMFNSIIASRTKITTTSVPARWTEMPGLRNASYSANSNSDIYATANALSFVTLSPYSDFAVGSMVWLISRPPAPKNTGFFAMRDVSVISPKLAPRR